VAALAAACAGRSRPAEEASMHAPAAATPVLLEIAATIRSLAAEHPPLARFDADAAVTQDGILYAFEVGTPSRPAAVRDDLLRRPSVPVPLPGGVLIWIRWLPDDAMPPQDRTTAVGRLRDGRRYAIDLRIGAEARSLEDRLWRVLRDEGWSGRAEGPHP
jgi:hypothetical protein